MNNPGKAQASQVLVENCREYLEGEIALLDPDIIVSQGRQAEESLRQILTPGGSNRQLGTVRPMILNGKDVLRIATYHSRARQRFWNEKKAGLDS